MSTLNEEILRLKNAKAAIDEVLVARGVSIPENATLDTYNELINSIQGGTSSEEVTATKANVLAGTTTITADSNDEIVEGTMPNYSGTQQDTDGVWIGNGYINMSVKNPGYYAGDSDLRAAASDFGDAIQANVLSGQTFTSSNGIKIPGTMPTPLNSSNITLTTSDTRKVVVGKNDIDGVGGSWIVSNSDGVSRFCTALQTSGYYDAGSIVGAPIVNNGAVAPSALGAGGSYTIPAGYHNGSGKVTVQSLATMTASGDATASQILSGKKAYVDGNLITGNIASKAAATYYATTADQTISAGQYLSGAQTIKKLTSSNFSAANIKTGVTVSVNNGNANVFSVAGTFCSDATLASAANLLSGQIAYGKGGTKYTGTMGTLAGGTYTPSTSAQTISCSGKKMTGNIVISAVPSKFVDFSAGITFFEEGVSETAMFTALGVCNQKPQAGIPVSEWKTTWRYKYDEIIWYGNALSGPRLYLDLDENDQIDTQTGFCTKKSMDFTGIKTIEIDMGSRTSGSQYVLFFYNISDYTITRKYMDYSNFNSGSYKIDISGIKGQCLWGMYAGNSSGYTSGELTLIKFYA